MYTDCILVEVSLIITVPEAIFAESKDLSNFVIAFFTLANGKKAADQQDMLFWSHLHLRCMSWDICYIPISMPYQLRFLLTNPLN